MMYYQVKGLRIKRKLSDINLHDSHEIKKRTGQRGYILAQVFNFNDTSMLWGGDPKDEKTATVIEVSKDCFTLPFIDNVQ